MSGVWAKRDSDWLESLDDDAPPTHEIVWEPTFRVRLALPPWADPEETLARLTAHWSDEDLGEGFELYGPEAPPAWVLAFVNERSSQSITEVSEDEA